MIQQNYFTFQKIIGLSFFCFFLPFTTFGQLVDIDYPNMPVDKNYGASINIGNSAGDSFISGISINSTSLTTSQRGTREGLRAQSGSNSSTHVGNAFAQIATSKAYTGDASFIGVLGQGSTSKLSNSNGLDSRAVGGFFKTALDMSVTLGSGKIYVGGVLAELNGTVNNTPSTGAVAAVIGRDLSSGTAQSWAAYLDGKNYLSDQTIIGRKNIPTQINLPDGAIDVSNYKLFVTGGIVAEECLIALENLWADYVFEEDYDLKSLEQVEQYIEENGYLPAFPSALEIGETGLKVGEITVLQQEKIEELFLHSIELNKQNKELVNQNKDLKAENEQLKVQMAAFEKRLTTLENK